MFQLVDGNLKFEIFNHFQSEIFRCLAARRRLRYILSANNAEGSHNGIAAVLKTAGRKAMQVRLLSPPPFPILPGTLETTFQFALPALTARADGSEWRSPLKPPLRRHLASSPLLNIHLVLFTWADHRNSPDREKAQRLSPTS